MHRDTNPASPPNDASHALQLLQAQVGSTLQQSRAAQRLAQAGGWPLWPLGGFQFADGSVLRHAAWRWQSLGAAQARLEQETHQHGPLDVRLRHTYEGQGGRQQCSVSEARFEFEASTAHWRLVVDYEAHMDSPLYGFTAECADALQGLGLCNLLVDTPSPGGRARLQRIALHPDWLELLCVSRRPEEGAMTSS